MAKKIVGFVKLQVPLARPTHPPRLDLHWVNAV